MGPEPCCPAGSPSADTEPHSTERPSQPSGQLHPSWARGCAHPSSGACLQTAMARDRVCRRGDACLEDTQDTRPPRPLQLLHRHTLAVPLQLRAGGDHPAWGQAHLKAASPQSCPGEPCLCLKAKLSTDVGQCQRLCLCGSESVMEMTSQACSGRAIHRLLSL